MKGITLRANLMEQTKNKKRFRRKNINQNNGDVVCYI